MMACYPWRIPWEVHRSREFPRTSRKTSWRAIHFGGSVFTHLSLHPDYQVVHDRNIWDGVAIAQNKKRLGYKTLFERNGLASIELKYHYPGTESAPPTLSLHLYLLGRDAFPFCSTSAPSPIGRETRTFSSAKIISEAYPQTRRG